MTIRYGQLCRLRKAYLLAVSLFALAGGVQAGDNPRDPYEGFNRTMFSVNEALDQYAAKPVAQAYDTAVPLPVKASVSNFFGNAGDFWSAGNSALQGKFGDAGMGVARLLVNSTLGIFGLFDVASEMGMDRYDEDFGQTLAVWGVPDGGYLFWPILGPRTVRDTAGWAVDSQLDPVGHVRPVAVRNSLRGLRFVDVRTSLLPADRVIEDAALDKYAYIRDAYLQRRRSQIYDGRPPRLDE
ncbi:MAG: VacJ family lipoprotein [Azonexus sp.]|nr:VacJ family lipoprotein [Azonexus sp.]